MSELLFTSICIVALLVLSSAGKRGSKVLLATGVLILSLAAGMRAPDVGIDTYSYYTAIATDFAWHPWQFDEEGFRAISRLLMMVFNDPTPVLFTYSLATNWLMLRRFWDFRSEASFSFMSFFYIAAFYIGTMNTMRQYLSVAILFFATRFLERRNYPIFIASLLLATSIHMTAIMGVAYLFGYMWMNTDNKKRIYLAIAAAIVIPVVCTFMLYYESEHIENYFSSSADNINITYIYRMSTFVLACLLMLTKSRNTTYIDADINNDASMGLPTFFCFLGLTASSAGMFFTYLERLGYYFLSFEAVFWGMAIRRKAWGWLFWLMPTVYALYAFSYEIAFNGSGIFPYHLVIN